MSTASTILRLELMGNGEQAGTWGSTTNVNLGTLIEGAIAGYTSVSITATPQALAAYNYAADQARMAVLILTGASSNFVLCAPPVSKTYYIYNNTSYTATISNATAANGTTLTAGATVLINPGAKACVFSDGTNFYWVSTQTLALGTAAAPSLSFVDTSVPASPVADADTGIYSPGANQIAIATNGVQRVLIDSNGATTVSKALLETRVAGGTGGSYAVDLSLGNYFTRTFNGNATITVSNVPSAGTVASFVFDITNAGAYTITWMTGIKWPYGLSPTLTSSGRDVLVFFTHDGGTTWNGFPSGINMS